MLDKLAIIGMLPELLLVVFVIIAEAYWQEAKDFYFKALDAIKTKNERIEYAKNYKRSLFMFRIVTFGMLLCLLSAIIPIFIPGTFSMILAKYLLGIISVSLVLFLVRMTCGYFIVKYLRPKELLKKIEEE